MPAARARFSPIPALLAILVLALLLGAYFKYVGFFSASAPPSFILTSAFSESAFLFANGELTAAAKQESFAPSFTDENGEIILFDKRTDGLYGCADNECARIIDFGKEVPGAVPFAVAGDLIVFVSPLTSEFKGFTLRTGNPVRIEPAFSASNPDFEGASSISADPSLSERYFVAGYYPAVDGGELRVCEATHNTKTHALSKGECATLALPTQFFEPRITLLP